MAKSDIPATRLDFEKMIDKRGDEFTAQTCNGTAKWRGTGWNRTFEFGAMPQLAPAPTWRPGRSNRTGE